MALADNLIAYWKMDESSGNPQDSLGTKHLTNVNTATFSTGKINNGLVLNGSNQYAYSTDASFNISDDTFSVSAWFNLDTVTANSQNILMSKLTDANTYGELFAIRVGDGGGTDKTSILFNTWASSGSFLSIDSGYDASASTWYHAVIVKESDSSWKIYINNNTPATSTSTRNRDTSGLNGISIGAYDGGSQGVSNYVDGIIDEVAIWNRALNSTEVSQLYNSGNGLQYPFSSTTIKTWNGLANASVKTVNGISRSSVKTKNGIS